MDKPLSQERLKIIEQSVQSVAQNVHRTDAGDWIDHEIEKIHEDYIPNLVAEVKRLQAIEAERDRYKDALDYCIITFQANEMFIKAEQIKYMIKGVNDHE